MSEVLLKGISKSFGDVEALKSLSLEISDKEFVVLLGPSGCGKTTALRCIAGLEWPDQGDVYIGGSLVNDVAPRDRDAALVFQNYALYPHMTVFNNLAFPLKLRGTPKETVKNKVEEVAQLLKIKHLLNRKPKQLSGGEQQRVALGRALVREPKVFLMDEPLSNLDAKLRLYMRAELKRLQKELGITTIYVTHDQAEAMTMADRIAILNNGVLQQFGTPDEIYGSPSNMFVAGFIGSPPMNFVPCALMRHNGQHYLDFSGSQQELPEYIQEVVRDGKYTNSKVSLGIRPDDVTLSKSDVSPGSIRAEVYISEPLGSEVVIDVNLGDTILKARTKSDFKVSIGETIFVAFDQTKIHLFDDTTGNAIA